MDVIERMFPDIQDRLTNILKLQSEKIGTILPDSDIMRHDLQIEIDSNATDFDEYPPDSFQNNAGLNNPYRNFFKTKSERAAVWNDPRPLKVEEMDLTQKAEAITEQIALKFYNWLKSIGGDEEPTLTADTIVNMFEIGFNYHAAQSLCVIVKDRPVVTDTIAKARCFPQGTLRYNLYRQLKNDSKAFSTTKMKQIAFGRMLPLELRSMPPKEDYAKKLRHCKFVPRDFASMERVWRGIEHLTSTKAFCSWLINHRDIPPPPYLVDAGMINTHFLTGPDNSAKYIGDS